MELQKVDVGMIWPFPERLTIEPRKRDGSLDVARIGTDELVRRASGIKTNRGLCDFYFAHNKEGKTASGQQVMDWLCDNGLVVRHRYW